MNQRFWNRYWRLIVLLLGLWLLFDLVSHLAVEIFWFREVGYLSVFLLRLKTQLGLWTIATFVSAGFLLGNLAVATKLKQRQEAEKEPGTLLTTSPSVRRRQQLLTQDAINRVTTKVNTQESALQLRWLLPIVLVLSLVLAWVLIYYAQEGLHFWDTNIKLPATELKIPEEWQTFAKFLQIEKLSIPIVQMGLLLLLTVLILISPQFWLIAIAVTLSLLFGFLLSARWDKVLQYFSASSFGRTDPLFNLDIGFYIFKLPLWKLCEFWLFGLFVFGIAAVTLIYLRCADSLSEGRFLGFSHPQRLHINVLGGLLMLVIALYYWLQRYELLYSKRGVNYGASYTAVTVQLPIYNSLSILAVAIALYLLVRTVVLFRTKKASYRVVTYPRQLFYALGLFSLVAAVSGSILPGLVHRLVVQPNELVRERPYIERTIALTREAFKLNAIEAQTFDPQGQLTGADLVNNDQTIRNIRLWDTRPLLEANRQLQQIRPYYRFPGADIDRYTLNRGGSGGQGGDKEETEKQQTIIAARELDTSAIPQQARTWVNEHLVYTHGYGFTLSPVNTVGAGGLPDYYVKDIGIGNPGGDVKLQISNERIRASIPIGNPRIYYGEISNTYVMTGTKTQEFDYPSGNDNVYNIYDGRGGAKIGTSGWRLLFAEYLKDWQMLLTRNFTPETKLLFRRSIRERVQAIAPFLRYDSDPYLVAADGGGTTLNGEKTYLYWILDAYTTSDRYPYSDPGNNQFNYIRNSVKVVIDAYNGTVNFYVADPEDPIITTLAAIFPNIFQPLDALPVSLETHLRYPVDFFRIQSERLLAYHMRDPQVFYNREDLWQIPKEIYGTEPRPVEPYYLIMNLPTAPTEEFILLRPFTPTQRNNLIAWLAARSDGDEYGKLLLYEFPKQQLVYGTEQIEALINQEPVISQQITLWNREGSRVIQGNLLVIPIEQSLLYVEPLYLEAEQNSLPTLVRVIVVYQNRIVMAETLQQGLQAIFQPQAPVTPAIVRPVEE
ncbi:MAG: UPF0182 family protein [Nostocaceae cyanobacterium]|nr:UPF0182 family protein [Nostocaceae cyanobacterium]